MPYATVNAQRRSTVGSIQIRKNVAFRVSLYTASRALSRPMHSRDFLSKLHYERLKKKQCLNCRRGLGGLNPQLFSQPT